MNSEENENEIDQEYIDLKAAEGDLQSELLKDSFFSFAAVALLVTVVAGLFQNYVVTYIISGLVAWITGFRLIGLAFAWGSLRAKRYELVQSSPTILKGSVDDD